MKPTWVVHSFKIVLLGAIISFMGERTIADSTSSKPIEQESDGSLVLKASVADITGSTIMIEGAKDQNLGEWTDPGDYVSWNVNITKPGKYRAEMIYSLDPSCHGNTLSLICKSQQLEVKVSIKPRNTNNWDSYRNVKIGEINLDEAGPAQISLKVGEKVGPSMINLKQIAFFPEDRPSSAEDMIPPIPVVQPAINGTLLLTPANVEIVGAGAQVENNNGNIGFWNDAGTYFHWTINLRWPGKYGVSWRYSVGPGTAESNVSITVGNAAPLQVTLKKGDDWTNYQADKVGEVTLDKAGQIDVFVKVVQLNGGYIMDLKSIEITPATSTNGTSAPTGSPQN